MKTSHNVMLALDKIRFAMRDCKEIEISVTFSKNTVEFTCLSIMGDEVVSSLYHIEQLKDHQRIADELIKDWLRVFKKKED